MRQGGFKTIPVAASTSIPGGAMVATDAAGHAVNAADTADLLVWGKASETVDNSTGAAGDKSISIELSIGQKDFLYANDSGSVVQADIGLSCLVKDNQSVTMSSTNSIVAGTVMSVSTAGVYVRFAF